MSQNSVIAAALLIGYIVFITVKGELSQYLAVLGLSTAALPSSQGSAQSNVAANPLSSIFGGGSSISGIDLTTGLEGTSVPVVGIMNAPTPGNVTIGPVPQLPIGPSVSPTYNQDNQIGSGLDFGGLL